MTDTVASVPPAPSAPPVKPGWQSTEFYGHAAAMVLSLVFASGMVTNSVVLNIVGIVASWLSAQGYTVSRTILKKGVPAAVILTMTLTFASSQTACVASSRADALTAANVGVAASSASLVAYDKLELAQIASDAAASSATATSLADGTAALARGKIALAAYLAKRATVDKMMIATYNAIAIATTVADDPSLTGAQKALAQFVSAVAAITGGGK